MKKDLFFRLLDSYGGDIERWPAEHRESAALFINDSTEARAATAKTLAIDRLLSDLAPIVDEGRTERLTQAVIRRAAI